MKTKKKVTPPPEFDQKQIDALAEQWVNIVFTHLYHKHHIASIKKGKEIKKSAKEVMSIK